MRHIEDLPRKSLLAVSNARKDGSIYIQNRLNHRLQQRRNRLSTAIAFQKRGHRVFAGIRNPSKASDITSLPNVTILPLDVTSKDSIQKAVDTINTETDDHGLDILINNAGQGFVGPILEADLTAGREMFEVNFWGPLSMTQAFAPLLIRAHGTIVNISSTGAIVHTPWISMYSSSKAAVTLVSETLRLELEPLGVRVMTAMVGVTKSNFHANLPEAVLREDSLYKQIEKHIQMAATERPGTIGKFLMPTERLAERLCSDVLSGQSGLVRRGGLSTTTWILKALMPSWLFVSAYIPSFMMKLNQMI